MDFNVFMREINLIKRERPSLFELERDAIVSDDVVDTFEQFYGIKFADSYRKVMKNIGGGYFGFIVIYSLDANGSFYLKSNVTKEMIESMQMLPVIDLETGDYIGYEINDGQCTEKLFVWDHDENRKIEIQEDFYSVLINRGLKNIID